MTDTIECIARRMSVWTLCPCPVHRPHHLKLRKLANNGLYRRVPNEAGLAALDRMIAEGYNGQAVASACGVRGDLGRTWLRRRKRGETMLLGPAACEALVNAKFPTEGTMDATIMRRKIRALARLGWSSRDLANMMVEQGLTDHNIVGVLNNIRCGYVKRAHVQNVAAINELYRQLEMTPAPDDWVHEFVRTQAKQKRWAAPLAWWNINDRSERPVGRAGTRNGDDLSRRPDSIDPIAVERACRGEIAGVLLTRAERAAVVEILRKWGLADAEIERMTRIGKVAERFPRETIDA